MQIGVCEEGSRAPSESGAGLTVLSTRWPHLVARPSASPQSDAWTPWFRSTNSTTCFTDRPRTPEIVSSPYPICRKIDPCRTCIVSGESGVALPRYVRVHVDRNGILRALGFGTDGGLHGGLGPRQHRRGLRVAPTVRGLRVALAVREGGEMLHPVSWIRRRIRCQEADTGRQSHPEKGGAPHGLPREAAAGFPDLRKKLRGRVARNFTLAIAPHFPQALLPSDIGIDFM
ncbi:hypothetical protein T484DRAFT_2019840, partial [Baffinella frigidus]